MYRFWQHRIWAKVHFEPHLEQCNLCADGECAIRLIRCNSCAAQLYGIIKLSSDCYCVCISVSLFELYTLTVCDYHTLYRKYEMKIHNNFSPQSAHSYNYVTGLSTGLSMRINQYSKENNNILYRLGELKFPRKDFCSAELQTDIIPSNPKRNNSKTTTCLYPSSPLPLATLCQLGEALSYLRSQPG